LTTVLSAQVSSLLCPSENLKNPSFGPGTRKNYVANVGGPAMISAWSGIFVALKDDGSGFAGVYVNGNSGRPVDLSGITDGTSNTAMLSETLIGSGPAANLVTIGSTRRRSTYLFPTTINAPNDMGLNGNAQAQALIAQCRSLPGTTPAYGTLVPPNGNIWLSGNPGSCMMWTLTTTSTRRTAPVVTTPTMPTPVGMARFKMPSRPAAITPAG